MTVCVNEGQNAIYDACSKNHGNILAMQIEHNVDLTLSDNRGKNVVHYACYNGHDKIRLVSIKHQFLVGRKFKYGIDDRFG